MPSDASATPIQCTIGEREILSGDGAIRRRLTVHCGPRRESLDLATCTGCDCCAEVHLNESGRAGVVICREADAIISPTEREPDRATTVRTLMATHVVCVMPDVRAEAVASLMVERGVSGIPVVDEGGHPVGMITWMDLLRVLVEPAEDREVLPVEGADVPRPQPRPLVGRTAADVMTPLVFSVVEGTELARAAALMSREGFHQIPVVMGDGTIGGLVSMRDVVRWVALSLLTER